MALETINGIYSESLAKFKFRFEAKAVYNLHCIFSEFISKAIKVKSETRQSMKISEPYKAYKVFYVD